LLNQQPIIDASTALPFVILTVCDFIGYTKKSSLKTKNLGAFKGAKNQKSHNLRAERLADSSHKTALVARSRRTPAVSSLPMLFGSFRPPKPENTIFWSIRTSPFVQKAPLGAAAEVEKKQNFIQFYEISRLTWRRTFCISPKEAIRDETPPSKEEPETRFRVTLAPW
jgi:hypothetical protein